MENLPDELKIEILLDVGYPDLLELCRTNVNFSNICHDELLWKRLNEQDFPGYEPTPGSTWRQLYEGLWREQHRINAFAQRFLRQYLMTQPRYARVDLMAQDITKLLNNFIENHRSSESIPFDDLIEFSLELLTIASGLQPAFVGYYDNGQLDFSRYHDLDLTAQDDVRKFIETLGYTIEE